MHTDPVRVEPPNDPMPIRYPEAGQIGLRYVDASSEVQWEVVVRAVPIQLRARHVHWHYSRDALWRLNLQ